MATRPPSLLDVLGYAETRKAGEFPAEYTARWTPHSPRIESWAAKTPMLLTTDQFNDCWPALAHESWLCRDAFHRFKIEGQRQIAANNVGKEPTRENNIAAYSAYADFIQHLHGTYVALFDMEVFHKQISAPPKKKLALAHDNFIRNEADRRQEPKSKIPVPKEFGKDLRDIRNRTNHAGHKRTNPKAVGQITLQGFYWKYHQPFVEVLYLQVASGYLDRHAAGGKWDAIEGFSVIAGNAAQRLSGSYFENKQS